MPPHGVCEWVLQYSAWLKNLFCNTYFLCIKPFKLSFFLKSQYNISSFFMNCSSCHKMDVKYIVGCLLKQHCWKSLANSNIFLSLGFLAERCTYHSSFLTRFYHCHLLCIKAWPYISGQDGVISQYNVSLASKWAFPFIG